MQYPKPVMKMSELKAMGFAESYLLYVFRRNDKAIAWKANPCSQNSPILFDTEEFEKRRQLDAKIK